MFIMCTAGLNVRYRDRATPRKWRNWTIVVVIKMGDVHYQTRTEFINFFRKRLNQRQLQFLYAYSFSNWRAVSCFSFWKAFVICPSLSVNGIFNDVIWRHLHTTTLQCRAKFSNGLVQWSIRTIRAKNYENAAKFVKVMPKILWPLFFPDTVYNYYELLKRT